MPYRWGDGPVDYYAEASNPMSKKTICLTGDGWRHRWNGTLGAGSCHPRSAPASPSNKGNCAGVMCAGTYLCVEQGQPCTARGALFGLQRLYSDAALTSRYG
eukprot:gene6003-1070_t